MKLRPTRFKQIAAVTGVTLALSLFAHAESGVNNTPDRCAAQVKPGPHQHDGMSGHGSDPAASGMPPMDDPLMQGLPPAPPFLHELNLTEAQQDKVFSILHNSAPALREQGKLAKKSAEALHEMVDSANFDETKLKSLAESHAHAIAEMEVIRARSMHQILALLTPEQRKQADAIKAKFDERHNLREQIRDINAKADSNPM